MGKTDPRFIVKYDLFSPGSSPTAVGPLGGVLRPQSALDREKNEKNIFLMLLSDPPDRIPSPH
jgi:hypothetical protein